VSWHQDSALRQDSSQLTVKVYSTGGVKKNISRGECVRKIEITRCICRVG